MYIIQKQANGSGGYPPLQQWESNVCPDGYLFFPDEFFGEFYRSDKRAAGFINYEYDVNNNTVTSVTWNDEAYERFASSLPDPVIAARENKQSEMSTACKSAIEAGVDIGDKHYDLDADDQRNIDNMFQAVRCGATSYPYHAKGEECTSMSAQEIVQLYVAYQSLVTYHTTYHNLLKQYINSITEVEEVENVTYGMELPDEYNQKMGTLMQEAQQQINLILADMGFVSEGAEVHSI